MELENERKWKSVHAKSREILYYYNRITGQQKWTNKNCFCQKAESADVTLPTLPCCTKWYPGTEKSGEKKIRSDCQTHDVQPLPAELMSRKIYCLGDIVNEIKSSWIPKTRKKQTRPTRRKNKNSTNKSVGATKKVPAVTVTQNGPAVGATESVLVVCATKKIPVVGAKKKVPVVSATKSVPAVTATENVPVVAATKSVPAVGATKNVPIVGATKNVPVVGATKNDPAVTSIQNVPVVGATKNVLAVTATKNVPAVTATKNVPAVTSTKNVPAVTATKNVPVVGATRNVPVVGATRNAPAVTSIKNVPAVTATKNVPAVASIKNVPAVTATKNVPAVTATKNVLINHCKIKATVRNSRIKNTLKRKHEEEGTFKDYRTKLRKPTSKVSYTYVKRQRSKKIIEMRREAGRKKTYAKRTMTTIACQTDSGTLQRPPETTNTNTLESKPASSKTNDDTRMENQDSVPGDCENNKVVQSSPAVNDVDMPYIQSVESTKDDPSTANQLSGMCEPLAASVPVASVDTRHLTTHIELSGSTLEVGDDSFNMESEPVEEPVNLPCSQDLPLLSQEDIPGEISIGSVDDNLIANVSEVADSTGLSEGFSLLSGMDEKNTYPGRYPIQKTPSMELESIVILLKASAKNGVKVKSTTKRSVWLSNFMKEIDVQRNLSIDKDNSNSEALSNSNSQVNLGSRFSEFNPSITDQLNNRLEAPAAPTTSSKTVGESSSCNAPCNCNLVCDLAMPTAVKRGRPALHEAATSYPSLNSAHNKSKSLFKKRQEADSVTKIHASFVDLSWRIVTSNGVQSASLSNFYKLVPVVNRTNQEGVFFFAVPLLGGPQVIAKILNTSAAVKSDQVFHFNKSPIITKADNGNKKVVISFQWEDQAVAVNPQPSRAMETGDIVEDIKGKKISRDDILSRVSIKLPKPLQIPEAGDNVLLGDFNVEANRVEFLVSHRVTVNIAPNPHLAIPTGALAKNKSAVCQTVKCRQGETRNDVETSKSVHVSRKYEKAELGKNRSCGYCGSTLRSSSEVKFHRRAHAAGGGIGCSECSRRFSTGGRLSVHVNSHKCDQHGQCAKCKKVFKTSTILDSHTLSEYFLKLCAKCRRKELKCKKCAARFASVEELRDHMILRHSLGCRICNDSFLFKRDLNKHMKACHMITCL